MGDKNQEKNTWQDKGVTCSASLLGKPNQNDCVAEKNNAVRNNQLDALYNRCRTEGGSRPIRVRCPQLAAKTGVTARNRARKRTKALPRLPAIRRGARTRKERTRKARKSSREGRRGQRNARTQAGAERKTNSEMGTQDALGNLVIEMKRPRNDLRRTLALYNTN